MSVQEPLRLAEGEYRFACLVWDHEPLPSGELVKLARSGGRTLSVLVDLRLLTESEQVDVLTVLRRCGADLVTLRKCADPADVRLAQELLGSQAAVKVATHQPEDYHLARSLLDAGALRVGVSQLAE